MKRIIFVLILFLFGTSQAQVGIGTTTPDSSALLEISSTSSGLLVPRMTQVQRDAIASPATGLLIYQTDNTAGFYSYNGSVWSCIQGDDNLGNHIATQNIELGVNWLSNDGDNEGIAVATNGSVGFGIASPSENLQIHESSTASNFIGFTDASTGSNTLTDGSVIGIFNDDFYVWNRENNHLRFGTNNTERMIIQNDGNVGILTSSPTAPLDVNGNVRFRNELRDASNSSGASGQVLSSTGTGTAWVNNVAITSTVMGTLSATSNSIAINAADTYTGSYIDLPEGKWAVTMVLLINFGATQIDDHGYWVRATFSDSNSTFSTTADFDTGSSTLYSGSFSGPNDYALLNGVTVINNTSGGTKRYYLWKISCSAYGSASSSNALQNFGTSHWGENQIIAQPVN